MSDRTDNQANAHGDTKATAKTDGFVVNETEARWPDRSQPGNRGLNISQMRILDQIRNNPQITKPQIAEALGLGKTTVDNGIAALKKKGFIKRVGSNKTGWWKVK